VDLLDVDEQIAVGSGLGRADQRAVLGLDGHGLPSTGQAHALGNRRGDADLGELPLVAWNQHNALFVADGGGERDAHAGKTTVSSRGISRSELTDINSLCTYQREVSVAP